MDYLYPITSFAPPLLLQRLPLLGSAGAHASRGDDGLVTRPPRGLVVPAVNQVHPAGPRIWEGIEGGDVWLDVQDGRAVEQVEAEHSDGPRRTVDVADLEGGESDGIGTMRRSGGEETHLIYCSQLKSKRGRRKGRNEGGVYSIYHTLLGGLLTALGRGIGVIVVLKPELRFMYARTLHKHVRERGDIIPDKEDMVGEIGRVLVYCQQ